MAGCMKLGGIYANGQAVTKDLSKAAQLYRKACDGGNKWACEQL